VFLVNVTNLARALNTKLSSVVIFINMKKSGGLNPECFFYKGGT